VRFPLVLLVFLPTLLFGQGFSQLSDLLESHKQYPSEQSSAHLHQHLSTFTQSDLFAAAQLILHDELPRPTERSTFAFAVDVAGLELHRRHRAGASLQLLLERATTLAEQSDAERAFSFYMIDSSVASLSSEQQRRAFDFLASFELAFYADHSLESTLLQIKAMNHLLAQPALAAPQSVRRIAQLLNAYEALALDIQAPVELRRAVLKGLGTRGSKLHSASLLTLISDDQASHSRFAPALMLCLADLGELGALPYIRQEAHENASERVHAAALQAHFRLAPERSATFLARVRGRFQGRFVSAFVQTHASFFYQALRAPDAVTRRSLLSLYAFLPRLERADLRRQWISELGDLSAVTQISLLSTLRADLSVSEKEQLLEELLPVGSTFNLRQDLRREVQAQNLRVQASPLAAQPLLHSPPMRSSRTYLDSQEYGDCGYLANGFVFGLDALGHTALYGGLDGGHTMRSVEVMNSFNAVDTGLWSEIQSYEGRPYWGSFTLSNHTLDFDDRQRVMATAIGLIGQDITYPVLPDPDLLRYDGGTSGRVEPHEITGLRCDGLPEYTYEYHGMDLWGVNGESGRYDVSDPANVWDHNDFFSDFDCNPNTELAPVVQCGRVANTSTFLQEPARIDLPSYDLAQSREGDTVHISLRASDTSGIHYIGVLHLDSWFYSPIQPQHPLDGSMTFDFSVQQPEAGPIHFFAMDNGGNMPEFASMAYLLGSSTGEIQMAADAHELWLCDPAQFHDLSSANPLAREWDFGDGQFSSEAHPTHYYSEPGSYTVSLRHFNGESWTVLTSPNFVSLFEDEQVELLSASFDQWPPTNWSTGAWQQGNWHIDGLSPQVAYANVAEGSSTTLTTAPFDLSSVQGGQVEMDIFQEWSFTYWYNYDRLRVEISVGTGPWTQLASWQHDEDEWLHRVVSLPSATSDTARLRFIHEDDNAWGTTLDNIAVHGQVHSYTLSGSVHQPDGSPLAGVSIEAGLTSVLDGSFQRQVRHGTALHFAPQAQGFHFEPASIDIDLVTAPVALSFLALPDALAAPECLLLYVIDDSVHLTWNPAAGASSYCVESSERINGDFQVDTSGVFAEESWVAPLAGSSRVYRVRALR
jgi:PKD repeat protein